MLQNLYLSFPLSESSVHVWKWEASMRNKSGSEVNDKSPIDFGTGWGQRCYDTHLPTCSGEPSSCCRLSMLSVYFSSCNGLWVALLKPDQSKHHRVNVTCHRCHNFPGGKEPSSTKDAGACDLSGFPGGFGAVYSS